MKPFLSNDRNRCAPQRRITFSIAAGSGALAGAAGRRGLRVAHVDVGHQLGDRGADRGPVRLGIVARPGQRLAQRLEAAFVAQGRQPGPAQQRPQRRIAQRRSIEFSEMGVAAAVLQQHGIADVVQRRAVFPRSQRAKGRAGDRLEAHAVSFRRNGEGRAALSMMAKAGTPTFAAIRLDGESTRPPPAG